jgi:hypothetical protein
MNLQAYQPAWDQVAPLMRAKLEAIATCAKDHWLPRNPEYTLSDIIEGGDEEFCLSMDVRKGDVSAVALDFTLLDADVRDSDAGFGVKLSFTGYTGLVLGGYSPAAYTGECFTNDLAVIAERIDALDVDEAASYIFNEALANPLLIKELMAAS